MQSDWNIFYYSLIEANASNLVNKIFVINNSAKKITIELEKVKVVNLQKNIYVNPAWNLGVSLSEAENIILMNDDIACRSENYDAITKVLSENNCGLCSIKTQTIKNIEEYNKVSVDFAKIITSEHFENKDNNKTGWFFALKRNLWKNIPGPIKIIYGDDLIYLRIRKLGFKTLNITNRTIGHFGSQTVDKIMPEILNQVNKDIREYHNFKNFYIES